eukprot:TRINITY_DN9992_c0_g4_i1.p1 TRINITY_DN9992_c0_g4~~TRINITY_DN9992_c0_g4_i1.p1  ORF type:complete len:270 (-),score=27.05 TRINITY_DN9992_c0_g4_i1:555-1364(-)
MRAMVMVGGLLSAFVILCIYTMPSLLVDQQLNPAPLSKRSTDSSGAWTDTPPSHSPPSYTVTPAPLVVHTFEVVKVPNATSVPVAGPVHSVEKTENKRAGETGATKMLLQTQEFCRKFVPTVATGALRPASPEVCKAQLSSYRHCKAIGAGHFGMGVQCLSDVGPAVIKIQILDGINVESIRNAAKEMLIGCQASLLKLHHITDTFMDTKEFVWCRAADSASFMRAVLAVDTSQISAKEVEARFPAYKHRNLLRAGNGDRARLTQAPLH